MSEAAVRRHFLVQSYSAQRRHLPLSAALYRAMGRHLDRGTRVGRRVLDWPGDPDGDLPALRLLAGFNALARHGIAPQLSMLYPPHPFDAAAVEVAVAAALPRHDDALLPWLDGAPQINEINRSAIFLPGFLAIGAATGLPLDLCEIGSSAGLNLNWDRYRYDYGNGARWGDPAAAILLSPHSDGAVSVEGGVSVARRGGCDLAPIDVADPAAVERLLCHLWPDIPGGVVRLEAAAGLARTTGIVVTAADAADYVERRLASRAPGTTFVLYHSTMWNYMPEASRQRIVGAIVAAGRAAGSEAPVAWLAFERAVRQDVMGTLRLHLWPGETRRDFGRADFDGDRITWLQPSPVQHGVVPVSG